MKYIFITTRLGFCSIATTSDSITSSILVRIRSLLFDQICMATASSSVRRHSLNASKIALRRNRLRKLFSYNMASS